MRNFTDILVLYLQYLHLYNVNGFNLSLINILAKTPYEFITFFSIRPLTKGYRKTIRNASTINLEGYLTLASLKYKIGRSFYCNMWQHIGF